MDTLGHGHDALAPVEYLTKDIIHGVAQRTLKRSQSARPARKGTANQDESILDDILAADAAEGKGQSNAPAASFEEDPALDFLMRPPPQPAPPLWQALEQPSDEVKFKLGLDEMVDFAEYETHKFYNYKLSADASPIEEKGVSQSFQLCRRKDFLRYLRYHGVDTTLDGAKSWDELWGEVTQGLCILVPQTGKDGHVFLERHVRNMKIELEAVVSSGQKKYLILTEETEKEKLTFRKDQNKTHRRISGKLAIGDSVHEAIYKCLAAQLALSEDVVKHFVEIASCKSSVEWRPSCERFLSMPTKSDVETVRAIIHDVEDSHLDKIGLPRGMTFVTTQSTSTATYTRHWKWASWEDLMQVKGLHASVQSRPFDWQKEAGSKGHPTLKQFKQHLLQQTLQDAKAKTRPEARTKAPPDAKAKAPQQPPSVGARVKAVQAAAIDTSASSPKDPATATGGSSIPEKASKWGVLKAQGAPKTSEVQTNVAGPAQLEKIASPSKWGKVRAIFGAVSQFQKSSSTPWLSS